MGHRSMQAVQRDKEWRASWHSTHSTLTRLACAMQIPMTSHSTQWLYLNQFWFLNIFTTTEWILIHQSFHFYFYPKKQSEPWKFCQDFSEFLALQVNQVHGGLSSLCLVLNSSRDSVHTVLQTANCGSFLMFFVQTSTGTNQQNFSISIEKRFTFQYCSCISIAMIAMRRKPRCFFNFHLFIFSMHCKLRFLRFGVSEASMPWTLQIAMCRGSTGSEDRRTEGQMKTFFFKD